MERYRRDAAFFLRLRAAVKQRYSDAIDYRQYEGQVQKLIDTHIKSNEVLQLTEQVNIFDKAAFSKEVEKVEGAASRADIIASRTAKTISERMEEDPVLYKKFSQLLEETIEAYRQKRIGDLEYLQQATTIMEQVRDGSEGDEPEAVSDRDVARAFYRVVEEVLKATGMSPACRAQRQPSPWRWTTSSATASWTGPARAMCRTACSKPWRTTCYDLRKDGLELGFDVIDQILEGVMRIAMHRYA